MFAPQRISLLSFNPRRLRIQLQLNLPPFEEPVATSQLDYIASYVAQLDCRSILIERHYIDRDYIEDHSLFYSRSLYPYPNSCQRVHFFTTSVATTRQRLQATLRSASAGRERYARECSALSSETYLGFTVIKPLAGSPVGRTILRTYPESTDDGHTRVFPCIRPYEVHVDGIELTVLGLPFQEQDVGVSACATTAIWSALQKFQESESLPAATPAQITTLASRFALPFGRALPADEGLSIDQMCQSVQALGVSPNLLVATDLDTTRGYLYSALRSQIPPILILQHKGLDDSWHAITAVGMRLLNRHGLTRAPNGLHDRASELKAIYVHDDRTGPYLRADLQRLDNGGLGLDLRRGRDRNDIEGWIVTHVLLPTHQKIRTSLSTLRQLAVDLVGWVHIGCEQLDSTYDREKNSVTFETWIARPHSYMNHLNFNDMFAATAVIRRLAKHLVFPRYVGIIRLACPRLGIIDVLIDTTSTSRNMHYVSVVVQTKRRGAFLVGRILSQICDAPLVA